MTGELLLAAAFTAGFFGGAHCIGMCGAIVLLFERQPADGQSAAFPRRLLYNLGRLGFYATLGAFAGAGGAVLTRATGVGTGLIVLRLLAAALVFAIGVNLLFNLGVTRFLERAGAVLWRSLSPLAKHFLPVTTPARAVAAGFLWGALPCGLVYSAVALAATAGSAAGGAVTMASFWLGTLPALLLAGASAERLAGWQRSPALRRGAGLVMLVLGLVALIPARMLFA